MKKKINIFVCLCLVITSYLLILNICNQNIFKTKNIEKELKNVSALSIIESEKLDNSKSIFIIRKDLSYLYSVSDYIGIDKKTINNIIDSEITNDIFVNVVINIMDYIKTDVDKPLFSINEFNSIIDENIDSNLDEKNISINFIKKKLLVKTLKYVGKNILKDIPNTSDSISSIPKWKLNLFRLIYNDNYKDILYVLTITLIIIMVVSNKKVVLLTNLKYCLLGISALLFITVIYLKLCFLNYGIEWSFLYNLINKLNLCLILYLLIFISLYVASFIYLKKKS